MIAGSAMSSYLFGVLERRVHKAMADLAFTVVAAVLLSDIFLDPAKRALHPDSPKPAIVGNCQGGWAAMMVAAADPEDTGPIVINGAPMSYWGGAWSEGEGDNPMRYAGGLLGGTWLLSQSP